MFSFKNILDFLSKIMFDCSLASAELKRRKIKFWSVVDIA